MFGLLKSHSEYVVKMIVKTHNFKRKKPSIG